MNSAVTLTATIFNHLGMPSGAAKSSYGFPLRDPQRPAVRPQRGPSAVIRNMSWEIFRFVCVLQYKCIFRTLTEDYYYLIINRRWILFIFINIRNMSHCSVHQIKTFRSQANLSPSPWTSSRSHCPAIWRVTPSCLPSTITLLFSLNLAPARDSQRSAIQGDDRAGIVHLQLVVVRVQAQFDNQAARGENLSFYAILMMVFFIELYHQPHTYFLEARSIDLIFTSLAWVPTLKLSVRGSETSVCLQPGRLNDTMEPSKVR